MDNFVSFPLSSKENKTPPFLDRRGMGFVRPFPALYRENYGIVHSFFFLFSFFSRKGDAAAFFFHRIWKGKIK